MDESGTASAISQIQRIKPLFAAAGPNLLRRSGACIAQIISLRSRRSFVRLAGQFDPDRIPMHQNVSRWGRNLM